MFNNLTDDGAPVVVLGPSLEWLMIGKWGLWAIALVAAIMTATVLRAETAGPSDQDATLVDCRLPGQIRPLGTTTTVSRGALIRATPDQCRDQGGQPLQVAPPTHADPQSGPQALDPAPPRAPEE